MTLSGPTRTVLTSGVLLGTLTLAACNFPGFEPTPDAFATSAAATVAAQLTESAAQIPSVPPPTDTPIPPTVPPIATNTPPGPSPTAGQAGCTDRATFVSDVTIPDDTYVAASADMTKTWRLRNSGTCTWTTNYMLVFKDGNIMGGAASSPLPGAVPPNSTVDVSIDLKAPATNGTYKGNWMLKNETGVLFGIGASADSPFFIQIIVGPTPTVKPSVVYSMTDNYCDAEWITGAGVLTCPGDDTDMEGFVIRLNNPQLENGITENEPGLWTHPEWVNDGVISGRFPPFNVESGDRFRAVIACRLNGVACNVKFQLNYRADGGALMSLGEWTQTYDGSLQKLDVDLSPLAGKSVEFVLAVLANGSSGQDWAIWLLPRIER